MLAIVVNKIALCEDSGAAVRRHWTMQKKLGFCLVWVSLGASKIGQKVALTHWLQSVGHHKRSGE